jgi:hypothetical protein
MANVKNDFHDSLVATADPDEEANRRRSLQISAVLGLVLTAMNAVAWPVFFYYSLRASSPLPLWFTAVISSSLLSLIVAVFWPIRRSLWKSLCEICNPEEELQIDAECYLK